MKLPADSVWQIPDGEAHPSPQMLAEKTNAAPTS